MTKCSKKRYRGNFKTVVPMMGLMTSGAHQPPLPREHIYYVHVSRSTCMHIFWRESLSDSFTSFSKRIDKLAKKPALKKKLYSVTVPGEDGGGYTAFEREVKSGYVETGRGCSGLKKKKGEWKCALRCISPARFALHTYSKPLLFLSVFIRAGNAYTWAAFLVVHGMSLWVYCIKRTPKNESEESQQRTNTIS